MLSERVVLLPHMQCLQIQLLKSCKMTILLSETFHYGTIHHTICNPAKCFHPGMLQYSRNGQQKTLNYTAFGGGGGGANQNGHYHRNGLNWPHDTAVLCQVIQSKSHCIQALQWSTFVLIFKQTATTGAHIYNIIISIPKKKKKKKKEKKS